MNQKSCNHCKQPLPEGSRKDKKYCSKGCKSRAYEKRKGKQAPFSIKQKKYTPPAVVMQTKPVEVVSGTELTGVDLTEQNLLQQKQYWETILNNALNGKFYASQVIFTGAGLAFSGKDNKLAGGAFGWLLGLMMDRHRKEQFIIQAQMELERIGNQLRELRSFNENFKKAKPKLGDPNRYRGVISGDDYQKLEIPSIVLDPSTPFGYILQEPKPNFYLMMSGSPGGGKTTFAVNFAKHIHDNHGPVIYFNSEQRGRDRNFQRMLKHYDAKFHVDTSPQNRSVQELSQMIKHFGAKMAVIDSVNSLNLNNTDIEALREDNPNTAFTVILQTRKDLKYKGSQDFLHNCDTYLKFSEAGFVDVEKNRSGAIEKGIGVKFSHGY